MKHCTLLGALVRRASRRATRLVVAAVLLASPLPLIMAAEPANAVTVDPPIDGTVLVVAPHPDDDVLMAAGITYNRPNTVIAFMTNGDSHTDENGNIPPGIAETRQGEAVTAQAILGQPESNLIFLGYPDYHLERTWNTFAPDVQPGAFGLHSETYASRGLGGTDWHDYRTGGTGQHAPYNHEAMLADVVALIDTYRPDHVFTTSPEDGTADHRTTYTVVKAAMEQVASSDPSYAALLHSTVIWQNPPDPALNERWPELYPGSGPPEPYTEPVSDAERAALGIGGSFAPDWDDREIFNVPAALMNPNPGSNPKYQAIEAHATQGGMDNYSYIARFFHSDEFFWVEQIGNPDGAGPEVVIAAPADGAVFEAGVDSFTASYSCTDPGSGVASCAGDVPDGTVVDLPTPGTGFTFSVTGTDNASNVTTVTHTYDVVDTTAPVITLVGVDPMVVESGSSFTDPGAVVTDNVDATTTITGVSTVDTSTPGTYSVTYDYEDAAGNPAAQVIRTVAVAPVTVLGQSVGFSGDDSVSVGDVGGLTGDVSYELWLKPAGFASRMNPLAKAYSGEGTITQETNGRLTFYQGTGGGNGPGFESLSSGVALADGLWNHVVVTREGTTLRWFVNGVQTAQKTAVTVPSDSVLPLTIGSGYAGGYQGGIDEVAVYGRALSATEVAAHFSVGASGDDGAYGIEVSADGPLGWWRLDEVSGPTAVDDAGAYLGNYSGTPVFGQPGVEIVVSTVLGQSVGFSGDDSVSVGDVGGLTGDVSYEVWLKPAGFASRMNPLAKAYSGEGTITQETNGRLTFYQGTGGGNGPGFESFSSGVALADGLWNHVVVTREGTTLRWFVNGVQTAQKTAVTVPSDSVLPLTIGSGYAGGYQGGIDEVAVYGRALSATEVAAHFSVGASGDDGAYGIEVSADGPLGWWRLDEVSGPTAVDDAGAYLGNYSGTPVFGQPGVEIVVSTVLGQSVGFSGDDSVSVGDVGGLTGDVSYEVWLKPAGFASRMNPLAKAYSGEGTITQETNGRLTFYQGTGGGNGPGFESFSSGVALADGLWNHVVVTREGTTLRWFVNGVQTAQKTAVTVPSDSVLPLTIGSGYAGGYQGGIDEVAVYGRALSATEVADHFATGATGDDGAYGVEVSGDAPLGWWRLDETTGPTAVDDAGAYPGAYSGTPAFGQPGVVVTP